MFAAAGEGQQGFPYVAQLKLLFKMGEQMKKAKNVKNDIFQQKQVHLIEVIAKAIDNSTKAQE